LEGTSARLSGSLLGFLAFQDLLSTAETNMPLGNEGVLMQDPSDLNETVVQSFPHNVGAAVYLIAWPGLLIPLL
jgi:hypothetical protein